MSGPDNHLIASDAVVIRVVNLLVFVRIFVFLVLEVPMLSAYSHSHCILVNAVLYHSPKQLMPGTVDLYDA